MLPGVNGPAHAGLGGDGGSLGRQIDGRGRHALGLVEVALDPVTHEAQVMPSKSSARIRLSVDN